MRSFLQKIKSHTYTKYLLSYMIIIAVLFVGFIFVIRYQLTDRFFSQRSEQLQFQMSNTSEWLNDNFDHLIILHHSIREELALLPRLYKEKKVFNYYTHRELMKYDSSATMISSIVYKPEHSTDIISTKHVIKYENDTFLIGNNTNLSSLRYTAFDPAPYIISNSNSGQFILLDDEASRNLLYFPDTRSLSGAVCFYILNTDEITQRLENIISDDFLAVALIDSNGKIAAAVNEELLLPYQDSFMLTEGIHALDSSNSICVQTGIYNDFSLIALISQDSLSSQINATFFSS